MLDTLLLRPSLHFTTLRPTTLRPTTLHSTSLHFSTLHFVSFKPNPTTLHYTSLTFHLVEPHLTILPLHFTLHHYTSLHYTSLHFWMIFATLLSVQPVYDCFPISVFKNLRLTRESPERLQSDNLDHSFQGVSDAWSILRWKGSRWHVL
jgi:hypothetical protein